MTKANPILSAGFLSNYRNWLMLTGKNTIKLFAYLVVNCLIILFFQKMSDPKITFGHELVKAPYFFMSMPAFGPTGPQPCVRDQGVPPIAFSWSPDHSSNNMSERIIPPIFNINAKYQLAPYSWISNGKRVLGPNGKVCEVEDSDTFMSYYITIITFIMWGYRYALQQLTFWLQVIITQEKVSATSIAHQLAMKFLLLFGWLVLLIFVFISFWWSMGFGVLASFTEHIPSDSVYQCPDVFGAFFFTPGRIANWFIIAMFILLKFLATIVVALCALMTGLFMWLGGPILWSVFAWVFYPLAETALYNYGMSDLARVLGYPSTANIKIRTVTSLAKQIFSSNKQFITFLILIIMWFSASSTMDNDFNTGLGVVVGLTGLFFAASGFSLLVKGVTS